MESILVGLNDAQQIAVKCISGPVLIVAGAGSGKTRVLTCRTAYLIEQGVNPGKILELTFTKKAATEMKERIAAMVGGYNARKICMGTFHSVFIRFLREYADLLGYPKGFTIYDQSSSTSAVKACIKQLGLDDKIYKPKDVLARISMAKNSLVSPAAYRASKAVDNDTKQRKGRICDIYQLYWDSCRASGVMDFDDILFNMNVLLHQHPDALESIASRFSHIMVDEYQDTNRAQYLILKKLAHRHHNLCVVGDDSQSIYAFRGAKIENIINFQKDYPESRVIRLEQNYRSTQNIVDAANSVIAKNTNRLEKKCFSQADKGEKIRLMNCYTDKDEAIQIASSILSRIREDSAQYQDFAVLYRTNSQSRQIEEQLRLRNIPYVVYSGNSFFDRAEVKDVMSYFNLVANLNDDEAFKRVVNKPSRGIGDTSLDALTTAAKANSTSLFKSVFLENVLEYGIKAPAVAKIKAFCGMILAFNALLKDNDAYTLATKIALDSGIWPFFKSDTSIEGQSRAANVEELLNNVKEFVEERHNSDFEQMQIENESVELTDADLPTVTLDEFLENISLLSNVDMESEEDTNNKVALMTIHSSKGLEFPYVHVAGMEENIFPSASMGSAADLEEERRLFYVALTRAEKAVSLSFCATRMRNGQIEDNDPSRFVTEIDSQFILNPISSSAFSQDDDNPGSKFQRKTSFSHPQYGQRPFQQRSVAPSRPAPQPKVAPRPSAPVRTIPAIDFTPSPIMDLRAGQRIEHNRFGFGKILSITKEGLELKANIVFDNYGEKMLILRYAKIRIVEK